METVFLFRIPVRSDMDVQMGVCVYKRFSLLHSPTSWRSPKVVKRSGVRSSCYRLRRVWSMITVSGGNITICTNNTAHLSAQVNAHAAPFNVRRQASPPPLIWWLNTPAINSTTSYNITQMPQGRGSVTRLTILVPAHTEGVQWRPLFAGSSLT